MTSVLPWASVDDFIASLDSVPWYAQGATALRWKVCATEADAKQAWLDSYPHEGYYYEAGRVRAMAEHKDMAGSLRFFHKMTWRLGGLGYPEAGRDAQMMANALYVGEGLAPELAAFALSSWSV